MIETLMIFALGFLSATLLALLALPAVTRRVQRLTRRRLEARLPLSLEQIAADRDRLRAASAVEHRRLEQKADAALSLRHQDQMEAGRRALRIQELTEQLSAQADRIQALDKQLADLQRSLTGMEGERDQRAADMARDAAALADLRAERDSLTRAAEANRLRDETQREQAGIAGADLDRQVMALKSELAAMQGALSMAQAERDRLDMELRARSAATPGDGTEGQPATTLQGGDLQALRREIDGLADRIMAMSAQAAEARPTESDAAETKTPGSRKRRSRGRASNAPRAVAAK